MDEIISRMKELTEEIKDVEKELLVLKRGDMKTALVSDQTLFEVRRGKRVTRKDGDQNPGNIPVYSGSKDPLRPICKVSKKFANSKKIPIETKPIIGIIYPIGWDVDPPYFGIRISEFIKQSALIKADYLIEVTAAQQHAFERYRNLIAEMPGKNFR